MKNKVFFIAQYFVLVLIFTFLVFGPSARGDIITGLVSHWKFDEGFGMIANDSSGNGNTGVLINGPSWVTGKVGTGALQFDGANDRIITSSDFIGISALTICMWVLPTSVPYEYFIDNGRTSLSSGYGNAFQFTSNGSTLIKSQSNTLTLNTWNHICGTRDAAGTANLYKNGTITGMASRKSGQPAVGLGNVMIGANVYGTANFVGLMDDLRIYNRVLSSSDILEVYNYTGNTLDNIPPVLSNGSPSGSLATGTTQTTLSVTTDENANCKWGTTSGVAYSSTANTFSTTGGTLHSSTITDLTNDSSYSYYLRCQDTAGNANASDYTISFSVASSGGGSATPVDLYLDMEAGSNTDPITTTIVSNVAHGTGCTYSVSPTMANYTVSTSADLGAMLTSVTVGGTNYDGSEGTRGWNRNHQTDSQTVTCGVNTNSKKVSFGGWFNTTLGTPYMPSWGSFDLIIFQTTGGTPNYCVIQIQDKSGSGKYTLLAHGDGAPAGGAGITLNSNTKYWYTSQIDTNSGVGTCRVGVYDVSGTQIGTSVAGVGMDQNINRIGIMSTQHGAVPAENTFFDNLIVDWTNGVFPLGI